MLYHGSKTLIKGSLEPRKSYQDQTVVYATDDILYALIRCGDFDITKIKIREEHTEAEHVLCEVYPGMFEEVFNRPGYIYVIDETKFQHYIGSEFISEESVEIVDRIDIGNVLDAIKNSSIKLVWFDKSDDYWFNVRGGRQGYIDRKLAVIEELKRR